MFIKASRVVWELCTDNTQWLEKYLCLLIIGCLTIDEACSVGFKSLWTIPSHIMSECEHAVSLLYKSYGNYPEIISNIIFEFVVLKWVPLVTTPPNQ